MTTWSARGPRRASRDRSRGSSRSAAICAAIAVLRVPPFDGGAVFVFGGFAALFCPLGQVAASALLPRADARAPALRRLDSLLLLGPAWPLLVGLLLQELS